MKRIQRVIISLCFCFALLCGSTYAEVVPSRAVITIDDVRVAFFSQNGDYMSPLETDGLVWVPAESLGESLGIAVSANPESLAVSVDGIRTAFFGDDGELLTPFVQDSVVYVPLKAFAESIGLNLTVSEENYAIRRTATAASEPTQTTPEYVWIKLNGDNFNRYFNCTIRTNGLFRQHRDSKLGNTVFPFEEWSLNVVLNCTARYGYDYRNVTFSASVSPTEYVQKYCGGKSVNFTGLTMPQSGELTRTENVSNSYISYSNMLMSDEYLYSSSPVVSVWGGTICVPRESMLSEWAEWYEAGLKAAEAGDYAAALESFAELVEYDYEDSAAQVNRVRAMQADAVAADHQAQYDQAKADLSKGKYDEAVETFKALKEENYSDSALQYDEAIRQRNDARFEQAVSAMKREDYTSAIELLRELKAVGYKGSDEQLDAAEAGLAEQRFEKYETDYQEALTLEAKLDFAAAIQAFRPLAETDYRDSAHHLEINESAQHYLDEQPAAYRAGLDAESESRWSEALQSFMTCLDYRNARAHAAVCMVNNGGCWILPPHNGGYYYVYTDAEGETKSGYGNIRTGEFRFLTDVDINPKRNRSEFWRDGLCVVSNKSGDGLMNADGEMVLDCEWTGFLPGDGCLIGVRSGTIALLDVSGKSVVEGSFLHLPTEGDAILKNSDVYANVNLHPSCYARTGSEDRQVITFADGRVLCAEQPGDLILSNDGQRYTVQSKDGAEVLIDEEGVELFRANEIYHDMRDLTTWECWHIYDGVIAYREDGKWGLWNVRKNARLAKPAWDAVCPFTDSGVARVTRKGKYGLVNAGGKMVISEKYENMEPFYDGRARVFKAAKKKIDGKQTSVTIYGFVNEKGREIIPMKYLRAGDFRQGFGKTWVGVEDGVLSGNHRMTKFSFYVLDKDGKALYSVREDVSYSKFRDCGLWFPDVYEMGDDNYIYANKLCTSTGDSLGLFQQVARIGDALIVARFHTKEYGGYHYVIFDREGREIANYPHTRDEMTFGGLSSDDGHLIWLGKNDNARTFHLITADGYRWRTNVPEAQLQPAEAEIAEAAQRAGIA